LKELTNKIEKLKIQKKLLRANSEQNFQRKKRTKRLIEKGALLEKYFDVEHLSPEETEELLKMFAAYVVAHTPNKFKKKEE